MGGLSFRDRNVVHNWTLLHPLGKYDPKYLLPSGFLRTQFLDLFEQTWGSKMNPARIGQVRWE